MKRVNLIREIDNIRNNLRPEGKKVERRRELRRKFIGLFLILGGLGWYLYEGPGWQEKPEELLKKIAEERGGAMAPVRQPRGVGDLMAPDAPPVDREGDWRVRYGLCNLEESCVKLVAQLTPQGIRTELIRGGAPHPAWQVVMGPWPTPTHAEEAMATLAREGIEASLTRATGQSWLVSTPIEEVDAARSMADRARASGVASRIEEAPSDETVYKVYDVNRYLRREEAQAACRERIGEHIDCVVEERPL